MPNPFEPWRDRKAVIERLLAARRAGATLCKAAAAAGVHIATVCRWQARDHTLRKALYDANQQGCRQLALLPRPQPPSCTPCHPLCPWASWRPRHPQDCPACGHPRYWSQSRLSIGCPGCGRRVPCE